MTEDFKIEPNAKIIYEWTVPKNHPKFTEFEDIAEAYKVVQSDKVDCGCIIYARYHGEWMANPHNARALVLHLLKKDSPPEKKLNEKIIKSSNIYKIEWDENNLWVHYNNESVYQYKDVPENVSIKMGEAESAGSFLHQNIKGKYRYERIN